MTKPKRKPHSSYEAAILREKLADAQEELERQRKLVDQLRDELAFERQMQHARVQRSQWWQ